MLSYQESTKSLPVHLFSSHFVQTKQKEKKNEAAVTVLKHISPSLSETKQFAEIHHTVCAK